MPVTGDDAIPGLQETQTLIAAAQDMASLRKAAARIDALVHELVDRMQSADAMTQLISSLHDELTRRIIAVLSRDLPLAGIRWCWIALGSEGRREQTLSSDQDNGIIFAAGGDDAAHRSMLLGLAHRINHALDDCGIPLCTGNVMAGNPQWCLSLPEWKERFRSWIFEGDPEALLNATIFFDLRPLYGAAELAEELGSWLAREAAGNRRFLYQMAANALQREIPLGLIRRFALEKKGKYAGTIDLKTKAAALFVDAGRIYGLASGIHASNTAERFRLATEARRLHPSDADRWIAAFHVIQSLRLKNQQAAYRCGEEMHNHLAPAKLQPADRTALLDALRQARNLHHRLVLDYPGIA
jgi:CBS domain-containing protein